MRNAQARTAKGRSRTTQQQKSSKVRKSTTDTAVYTAADNTEYLYICTSVRICNTCADHQLSIRVKNIEAKKA